MITLADLRARHVLPTWQEAVAIVQELVSATNAGTDARHLPALENVGLAEDGAVVPLPGNSVADHPVRHLAVILDLLLEDVPAPEPLKALVGRNVTDPPEFQAVEAFSRAVSFFERPHRRADIQALVERASAAAELTRADEELRRLQVKTQEAGERTAPEKKIDSRPRRRRTPIVFVGILTAALVVLAGAGAWYMRSGAAGSATVSTPAGTDSAPVEPVDGSPGSAKPSASGPAAADPPAQPVSLLSRLGNAVRSAASSLTRAASPPPPPAAVEPTVPATNRRPRKRGQPPPAQANRSTDPARPIVIVTELGGRPLEPAAPDLSVDTSFGIYTSSDKEVHAPVMVRPVLPTSPPANVPANQLGTLELLVDERGDVEHVRLVSPFNRHQERMIVSSAKAWKFSPATRNGHPVKYRTKVRLTI